MLAGLFEACDDNVVNMVDGGRETNSVSFGNSSRIRLKKPSTEAHWFGDRRFARQLKCVEHLFRMATDINTVLILPLHIGYPNVILIE